MPDMFISGNAPTTTEPSTRELLTGPEMKDLWSAFEIARDAYRESNDQDAEAYGAALDRLLEARTTDRLGLAYKLKATLESGAPSAAVIKDIIEDLIAPVSLDLGAIHSAADAQIEEIYRLHARISNGLDVLREVAGRIFLEHPANGGKLLFLVDTLDDAADAVVSANDSLTAALDPIDPRGPQNAPQTTH